MSTSGVVRLGSKFFPVVKIHIFGRIVNGGTPSSNERNWDGDIPFITPPDLNGLEGRAVVTAGRSITELGLVSGSNLVENGVIISGRAPVGYVGRVIAPSAFNQGCKVICTDQDHRYVAYALTASKSNLELLANGTTFSEISSTSVANYAIPLPPLETQQRIADYLDRETAEIDAAVTDLDRYVKLLSLRVKTAIHHAVLGGVDSESRKLLHPVIGTIPSSWAVSKFSVEFLESNNLNGPEPVGDLLSISEFHGVIVNNRGQEGQQSSEDVSHYRVVKPNQLAANMMWLDHGGLGVSSLRGYISPDYRAFDISNKLLPEYVHYLLRSKSYVDYFSTISVGVRPNAKRTTKVTLGMTPIPVPPLEVQASIVSRIEAETLEIESLIAESTKLRELLLKRRSVLITDVVTGRKQV